MTHQCIKCKNPYEDEDPDAYLCPSCIEAKKAIAAQVDAQFALRPKMKQKSDLELFDESAQTMVVDGRKITFNRA